LLLIGRADGSKDNIHMTKRCLQSSTTISVGDALKLTILLVVRDAEQIARPKHSHQELAKVNPRMAIERLPRRSIDLFAMNPK